jgi:hypothetical protein
VGIDADNNICYWIGTNKNILDFNGEIAASKAN